MKTIFKNYKPLPKFLTIRPSITHGLGLFATEKIFKNTNLGISHHVLKTGEIIRTPLGGFFNHSEKPNCYKITSKDLKVLYLFTTKDIEVGEEILVNYTLYDPTED